MLLMTPPATLSVVALLATASFLGNLTVVFGVVGAGAAASGVGD